MTIARTLALAVAAAVVAHVTLQAQDPCWAPDRSQAPDRAVARTAPIAALTADIARVSEVLKQDAAFRRIAGTRLMVTSYIGYAQAGFGHEVRISAGLYPPNTWREACTLMSGPEFFNAGHVHVRFNTPGAIFDDVRPRLKDEQVTAYAEPTGAVRVGEETYYDSLRGVVLTPGRMPAWVPVTVADWFAYRDRETSRRIDRARTDLTSLASSIDRYRTDMSQQIAQATSATEQARLRKAMDDNIGTLRAANAQTEASATRQLREAETERQRLLEERARLSPEQLAAQARPDGTPLVMVNPALAGGRGRVNLIVVRAVENAKAMAEPLRMAVREIDFAALRQLLR